jgi:hypothetical protein
MSAWWRWLWSPCLFGHEVRTIERGPRGELLLVCPRCRHTHVVQANGF